MVRPVASAGTAAPHAREDARRPSFELLHQDLQEHVAAMLVDQSMRETDLTQLAGALMSNRKLFARVQGAIADRLRHPTPEQRAARNDRELGFALSRRAFEALKRSTGDDFRVGFKALLRDHLHVEISFDRIAFAEPVDVFGERMPSWPKRPVVRVQSPFLQLIARSNPDSEIAAQCYRPVTDEQRAIVIEELEHARDLANLRWNGVCSASLKPKVLALLDKFAERTDARARPRIEFAFHCDSAYVVDESDWTVIDRDDVKRLNANPLIAALDLGAPLTEPPVVDMDELLANDKLEYVRLDHYELACAAGRSARAAQSPSAERLRSLTLRFCRLVDADRFDAIASHIARCSRLETLALLHCEIEEQNAATVERVAPHFVALKALRTLAWMGMNMSDDEAVRAVLAHPTLKSLRVSHNAMTSSALQLIADHGSLEEVSLSYNFVDDEGADVMARAPRLQRIDLSNNRISQYAARRLASVPDKRIRV